VFALRLLPAILSELESLVSLPNYRYLALIVLPERHLSPIDRLREEPLHPTLDDFRSKFTVDRGDLSPLRWRDYHLVDERARGLLR
jgi:hypothetical protein